MNRVYTVAQRIASPSRDSGASRSDAQVSSPLSKESTEAAVYSSSWQWKHDARTQDRSVGLQETFALGSGFAPLFSGQRPNRGQSPKFFLKADGKAKPCLTSGGEAGASKDK